MSMTATLSGGFVSFGKDNVTVKVSLQGATVISYTKDGREILFTSAKSALQGPGAIRGGIPLVFPCFGPPPADDPAFSKLKQHGFARISQWQFEGETADLAEGETGIDFTLLPTQETKAIFEPDWDLRYSVVIEASGALRSVLKVTNPATAATPLKFQTLMHTYLALPNGVTPAEVEVVGLDTLSFADKVAKTDSKQEGSITFPGEVDRVYRGAPAMALLKASDQPFLEVHKDNYADFVVWNPHQAKSDALADMEADGWRRFVCVEPGHASTWVTLQPGESSVSSQRLVPA